MIAQRTTPDHAPELPWNPHTGDVICDRIIVWDGTEDGELSTRRRFNVVQQLWAFPTVDMGWGDEEHGGLNFSLAICDLYIPWRPGDTGWIAGRELACHPVAAILAVELYREQIRHMPFWGGILLARNLRQWVRRHRVRWEERGIDLTDPGLDGLAAEG